MSSEARAATVKNKRRLARRAPRNPLAVHPLLRKSAAHRLRNKRAARALQAARFRRLLKNEAG